MQKTTPIYSSLAHKPKHIYTHHPKLACVTFDEGGNLSNSYRNSETQRDSNRQFFCHCFYRCVAPLPSASSSLLTERSSFATMFHSSTFPHFTSRINILIRLLFSVQSNYSSMLCTVVDCGVVNLIFCPFFFHHTQKIIDRQLNIV